MASRLNLFEDIDRMDADAWVTHLAPDVVMQFANEDPVYGRETCRQRALILFTRLTAISHDIIARWEHGDATIVETQVTFTLPDETAPTLPMVTIYRTDSETLISDYRVYLDPSPLRGVRR